MSRLSRRRFLQQTAIGGAAASVVGLPARSGFAAPLPQGSPDRGGKGAEAMEDALALLSSTGPEYHGGLANHGPMAAEALVVLDRPEAVVPWVERYRRRLDARPSGSRGISDADWREALGERRRVPDWLVFFGRRVEEKPWRAVVAEWVPRLMPGMIAAAFHGVIRTAHAVRSLEKQETPARVRELADGLAYWAANYNTLPERAAREPGRLKPSQAIGRVAAVPEDRKIAGGFITSRLDPLDRFPEFEEVADLVDVTGDSSTFLSDLTETFAGVYLANVPPNLITFVHSVTGPSAIRLLLPYLDAPAQASALRYGWQGAASFQAAMGGKTRVPPIEGPDPPRAELIERAIATGDEHSIKFVEACLREHARNPKPVYLAAARDAVSRLG